MLRREVRLIDRELQRLRIHGRYLGRDIIRAVRFFVRYWLPVIVWSALILATSTDLFSSHHSGSIIAILFGRFLTARQIDIANIVFRKLAHLTGYGILGALWFRALRGERTGWSLRWALGAVAIAAAVAGIDEWHQSFVPSRGASSYDVILDAAGAALAQIVARLFLRAES